MLSSYESWKMAEYNNLYLYATAIFVNLEPCECERKEALVPAT